MSFFFFFLCISLSLLFPLSHSLLSHLFPVSFSVLLLRCYGRRSFRTKEATEERGKICYNFSLNMYLCKHIYILDRADTVAFQQFEPTCLCLYTLSVLRYYLLCCKGGSSMVSSCFCSAVIQVHKMDISVHSGS